MSLLYTELVTYGGEVGTDVAWTRFHEFLQLTMSEIPPMKTFFTFRTYTDSLEFLIKLLDYVI